MGVLSLLSESSPPPHRPPPKPPPKSSNIASSSPRLLPHPSSLRLLPRLSPPVFGCCSPPFLRLSLPSGLYSLPRSSSSCLLHDDGSGQFQTKFSNFGLNLTILLVVMVDLSCSKFRSAGCAGVGILICEAIGTVRPLMSSASGSRTWFASISSFCCTGFAACLFSFRSFALCSVFEEPLDSFQSLPNRFLVACRPVVHQFFTNFIHQDLHAPFEPCSTGLSFCMLPDLTLLWAFGRFCGSPLMLFFGAKSAQGRLLPPSDASWICLQIWCGRNLARLMDVFWHQSCGLQFHISCLKFVVLSCSKFVLLEFDLLLFGLPLTVLVLSKGSITVVVSKILKATTVIGSLDLRIVWSPVAFTWLILILGSGCMKPLLALVLICPLGPCSGLWM